MIGLDFDGFDWDKGNWPKCGKHGVSKSEIERLFLGQPLVMIDPYPHEERLRAIGNFDTERPIFVVFMFRNYDGGKLIRPISARYMHEAERAHYEKQQ